MNIVCAICSELLVPSDDIFHTPCGHIFHFVCLIRWLERSKTCPQCRERTTENKIHRIYFNFSNSDSIIEDPVSLQSKIDNMTFQLQIKDININNLTEAKEKLEKQTAGLRKEVKRVESEINGKNSAIYALKEQIEFYKRQCQDVDTYQKEIEQLKENIKSFKNLQILLDASVDEVDDIMAMTCDIDKLKIYIVAMKKNMKTDLQKRRELRDKARSLQQELMQVSAKCKSLSEEHIKRKELEEQLIVCESEKITLQSQLLNMKENACKCVCNKISAEKESSLHKDSSPESSEITNEKWKCLEPLDATPKLKHDDSSCIIIESDNTTPRNIKSEGFFLHNHGMKRERSNNNLKIPSILAKKSKFNTSSQKTINGDKAFDGFGGHTKYEQFPNPHPGLVKRREDRNTKKLKLVVNNQIRFTQTDW